MCVCVSDKRLKSRISKELSKLKNKKSLILFKKGKSLEHTSTNDIMANKYKTRGSTP